MVDLTDTVEELRAQVMELQRARIVDSSDAQLTVEKKKWIREKDRLRKQLERQAANLKSEEDTRAISLANFRCMPPDCEHVVFSTATIAEGNEENEKRLRNCSQVSPMPQIQANPVDHDSVQRRKSGPHQYSNTAVSYVYLKTVGPNMKRSGGIGGTAKNPEFLSSIVVSFFTTCISIRALCKVAADQIESRALEAKAILAPLGDRVCRKSVSTAKPINVTGRLSRATLTDAISAAYLAIDFFAGQKKLVSGADVVTFCEDSSTFGAHDMLGMVLVLSYFISDGCDAVGHPRHKILCKSLSPNAKSCADHISKDVRRRDGTLFGKAVPQNMCEQLFSSGHMYHLLQHPCVYGIMDKGSESMGAGKGKIGRILRHSFYGRGSPMEQIFGTREAVEAAMKGEDWPYLSNVMEFLGIPKNQQHRISARPLPPRLDTSKPVFSVPFKIRILERRRIGKGERPIVISVKDEMCSSRISIENDPLSLLPVFLSDHGLAVPGYCDKHMVDRAVVAFTKPEEKLMTLALRVVREWRYMQNHIKLKYHVDMVLGIKGSGRADTQHLGIREALGKSYVDEMKIIMPRGWTRQEEAVESRWNMLYKTISNVATKRKLVAAIMPLALAHGTEDAKVEAGKDVCSKEGFRDKNKIQFPSKKVGRAFGILVSPNKIVYIAIVSMIHKMAWQPLLAACADRSEFGSSAMHGLGSMARAVNFVLTRGLFVSPSAWNMLYRLGHRGFPCIESKGTKLLSRRLEKKRDDESEPPRLIEMYGQFYNSSMGSAISELRETIKAACYMDGPILSSEHQRIYSKERVERLGQDKGNEQLTLAAMQAPSGYSEKMNAAMWLVQYETNRAASCLRAKTAGIVSCPLGFLAALYDVHRVSFIPGAFDNYQDENEEVYMDIATPKALASAACLLLQMNEALQAHGQDLHKWLPEPLRTLVKESLGDLATFAEGQQVEFETRGSVSPGSERISYPKPVTAFPRLCKLALQASARPTNNNRIESKWSLLTHRHQSRVRNVGTEYLSNVFRQKDALSSNLLKETMTTAFHEIFQAAREFRAKNKEHIASFYQVDQDESEDRQAMHQKPKKEYACSNITEDMQEPKSQLQQPKAQTSKTKARELSKRKDQRRTEQSNSEESSEAEDEFEESFESQESASCSDSDSESQPANFGSCRDICSTTEASMAYCSDCDESASADLGASIAPASDPAQRVEQSPELEGSAADKSQSCADLGLPLSNVNASSGGIFLSDRENGSKNPEMQESSDNDASDAEDLEEGCDQSSDNSDEEEGSKSEFLSHPFPNPINLNDEEAQRTSPFKLSYIRYLILNKKWESTKVDFDKKLKKRSNLISEPLILTRLDGKKFPLMKSDSCFLFYVYYGDQGLELINVEKVLWKVPNSEAENAMAEGNKKPIPEKVCVEYTRALSTQEAIGQCKSTKDYRAPSRHGVSRPSSLGSSSLRQYLTTNAGLDSGLIFHKGDFPYETLAENIVGFVAWEPLCVLRQERSVNDRRALVTKINGALAHAQVRISMLEEVDCVHCGPDFSERDGR